MKHLDNVNPFERLKARYCLAAMAIAWYLPGSDRIVADAGSADGYWIDLASQYYAHLVIGIFIVGAIYACRLNPRTLLGRLPRVDDLWPILKLDALLFSSASVLTTVIFLPISFLLPSFFTWWLDWINHPSIYLNEEGAWPLLPNALGLLSLVVLAPVLEEILFRGFLLHRFARKWGRTIGILASSALFGALHPDTLEAGLFGVAMCLLYMHTRSLYVSMIAHGLYNLSVWLFEAYDALDKGLEYYHYDLDQFRSDCWAAGIYALIAIVIVDNYLRRSKLKIPRRLPAG
jgi:membrane protease YdiL (CAAX protease family)